MDGQPKEREAIAFGRFTPGEGAKTERCEIQQDRNPDGTFVPGRYIISLPPGTGPHRLDIQLQGDQPRRYNLENVSPHQHVLRTFTQVDTPSMMADTGFEVMVSRAARKSVL